MIHLIVGNTGSGKTTYSQKLKNKKNAIVYSIDKWNKTLFLPDKKEEDGLDWFLERIDRAESIILDLVIQQEIVGVDSILDLGLSKFEHRKKFGDFAETNSIELKLHFLDLPKEIRWKRILKRNNEKGTTYEFKVTKEDFEFMESWFEPPTVKELEGAIVVTK